MKKGFAFCFIVTALVVSVLGLVGCGGGDQQQKEGQQAKQPNQPNVQPSSMPPAPSGNRSTSGLIGTWDLTHINGEPVDPGTGSQTFSEDGTFQAISTDFVGGNITTTGQYRVLDDSHIQRTPSGEEPLPEMKYTLDGDTLTLYVEDPEFPIEQTWQRRR